jgi:hypothetical protein
MWRLRKLAASNEASQIAEAAVVLPLLMMMLLGIYWFGRAYNIYATINHAAIEGARAASAPSCASCGNQPLTEDEVADLVTQSLLASKLDPALAVNPGGDRPSCTLGVNTPCSKPSAGNTKICVYYNLQLYTATPGEPPTCGVGVSFEYPYQFYFPFTPLHMQQIQLAAAVQVRGEH